MREMKDSGVNWCQTIPSNWSIIPSKYLFRDSNVRRLDGDVQLTASQKYGIISQVDYMEREQVSIVLANKGLESWKHVEPLDFIISLRSFQGGLEMSEVKGCITWHYVVLKATQTIHHGYYKWLFKSAQYITALQRTCNFIRDGQDLRYSNFSKVPLPYPSVEEQQAIASFLDEKCQEIEALMEDIRAEISTLEEYKKSVITEAVTKECSPNEKRKEGKEENPKYSCLSWKIQKLKYIAELNPKQYNQITVRDMVTFTPMENIKNGYYINKEKPYSLFIGNSQYSAYEEGDIVFAKVTPCFENGNIAIMEGLINKRGFGSSELFVIRPNKIEQKFLFYVLQNANFLNYGVSSMTGTGGLKRVSSYAVNNYTLALPETKEQKNIVSFLDKKCADINDCIEKKRLQLATLAEYKKSLIYEYVTGKKEVPHK